MTDLYKLYFHYILGGFGSYDCDISFIIKKS